MSKSVTEKYTDKPKRQADQFEEGYKKRDIPNKEVEMRSWTPVNFQTFGIKRAMKYGAKSFGYRGL